MTKFYTNNFTVINLYEKPSTKSEVVTQMIYGDSFSIQNKTRKWLKIKIKEDNYKGYIKKKKYSNFIRPTHKISVLKSKIFKFPNRKKINEISFGCKVKIMNNSLSSYKFSKGWINKKDVKPISYKERDIFKNIKDFKNIKYKWGGKSFKGIDCSALVQIFLNFNNKFCPRDAKDQVRYFNKNIKLKDIKKNDIIYWKGHVAIALSNKKLIHAYGPMKKTIIMGIDQTIKRIEKTAGLKVIAIKRLK
tara:strand:- start:783 stop:1523 length:741 start_codon:yes stop_codon:yes gene_type:complete